MIPVFSMAGNEYVELHEWGGGRGLRMGKKSLFRSDDGIRSSGASLIRKVGLCGVRPPGRISQTLLLMQ